MAVEGVTQEAGVGTRTTFEIGTGKWKNTSILKDEVKLSTNLFLFREE